MLSTFCIVDLHGQTLTTCFVRVNTATRLVKRIRVVDDAWFEVSHVRILNGGETGFDAV